MILAALAVALLAAPVALDDGGAPRSDEPVADGDASTGASLEHADAELKAAKRHLIEGDLEQGLGRARSVRQAGGLSPTLLARAWLLEGLALALLERPGDAERSFATALRVDRALDPGVKQAEVDGPFARARSGLPPAARALHATRAPVTAEEGSGMRSGIAVRLVADDLGLVAGARVGEETLPLDAEHPLAFFAAEAPGSVALVDEHGNVLLEVARDGEPAPAATPSPDARPGLWDFARWPWLTLAGGAIILTGAALAVVAGALVSTWDRGLVLPDALLPVAPFAGTGLLVGVGAGLTVVVAGAGVVVTDVLLRRFVWTDEESAPTPEAAPADAAPAERAKEPDPAMGGSDDVEGAPAREPASDDDDAP